MSRKKVFLSVLMFTTVGCVTILFAGQVFEILCKDKACGFKSTVSFGGGKMFDKITGFCVECDEFVYITRDRREKKPESLGTIWDPSSGKTRELYPCPECGKPFLTISSIKDVKHCPKCMKATIEYKLKALID